MRDSAQSDPSEPMLFKHHLSGYKLALADCQGESLKPTGKGVLITISCVAFDWREWLVLLAEFTALGRAQMHDIGRTGPCWELCGQTRAQPGHMLHSFQPSHDGLSVSEESDASRPQTTRPCLASASVTC